MLRRSWWPRPRSAPRRRAAPSSVSLGPLALRDAPAARAASASSSEARRPRMIQACSMVGGAISCVVARPPAPPRRRRTPGCRRPWPRPSGGSSGTFTASGDRLGAPAACPTSAASSALWSGNGASSSKRSPHRPRAAAHRDPRVMPSPAVATISRCTSLTPPAERVDLGLAPRRLDPAPQQRARRARRRDSPAAPMTPSSRRNTSRMRSVPNTLIDEDSAAGQLAVGHVHRHAPVEQPHGLELGLAPGQVHLHPGLVDQRPAVVGRLRGRPVHHLLVQRDGQPAPRGQARPARG